MPLHYTKIFSLLALLTVSAFLAWLVVGSLWQGESEAERAAPPAGATQPDSK